MIKTADRSAAYLEATRLAGFAATEARQFFGPPPQALAGARARLPDALAGRARPRNATSSGFKPLLRA